MTGTGRSARGLLVVVILAVLGAPPARGASLTQVDPMIGAGPPGDVFIGAQVPFGFAAPGPDTLLPSTSGYTPGQPITGFSVTHESGTGGAAVYGNFRVTPAVPGTSRPAEAPVDQHASPGAYSVVLRGSRIRAELTAARLAGLERYTYPAAPRVTLTLDAASVLDNTTAEREHAEHVRVRLTGPRSFEGGGTFAGGWGDGRYRLFFAAQVDRRVRLTAAGGTTVVAAFDTRRQRSIGLRIGISYTSTAMARRHLSELPGFDFAAAVRAAQFRWRSVLGEIRVQGGTGVERRLFATALYHAHLMPHDVSGDGHWPRGPHGGPHYEDFFTLWDTFRTLDPLLELTEPRRVSAMLGSLIATYRSTGWLPDARVATHNGVTQVGSNGDVLVADALTKGLTGVPYATAYRALVKDATVESPDPWMEGRVLADWHRLHYVATDQDRSASRTLEYAYDDFAVSEVAERLGHRRQATEYRRRAGYWANLWDPATQSIRPRNPDGSFLNPFDPTVATFSLSPFYEGSAREWSTFVPQDVQGLINRLGGDRDFVSWLAQDMACCYDPGNEPDLLAPWLYIHAGRPDLTDATVRSLLKRAWHDSVTGVPGNDDAGTLSAGYVWSAVGLYPNAGQPYYYIGAPLFTRTVIRLSGRRTFTIDAPRASSLNEYVDGATLDHRRLDRAFITQQEVDRGGTLVLRMARAPSGWGERVRPFSLSRPATPG